MSKLQTAYNNLISNFPKLVTLDRLVNSKNKFTTSEKNLMLEMIQEHIETALDIEDDLQRRLGMSVADVEAAEVEEAEVVQLSATKSVPVFGSGLTIIETGRAFGGQVNNVVAVPVELEPLLHESQRGSYSWRTRVIEDPSNFRHISVSKFYAKAKDNNGNWYALVDSKWETDQPGFSSVCNK